MRPARSERSCHLSLTTESVWEAPKPYLHPLRTPAGNVVTDYRPNESVPWLTGFDEVEAAGGSAVIVERLSRRHHDGTHRADEQRRIELHDVEYADEHGNGSTGTVGSWTLTWSTAITNRRTVPVHFGSPTTHGREGAGCTGLFWRGLRAFRGGQVLGPEGSGSELMGTSAPWPACSGKHDGADGHAEATGNSGSTVGSGWRRALLQQAGKGGNGPGHAGSVPRSRDSIS
ncbi:DUF6807 family protein [Streptomyces sp. NBC_01643]|uniref:DUF6807 family protein n=1 Tax=Streptomyces sp. NBC_01643 TaxID=2975906 RepID=UPI00386F8DE2|nr:PmoA family protein [Streptomyces sp. NBC_01643]